MKDLSLFLLRNSFGSKMRKSFKNFCNDDGSTSTLQQGKPVIMVNDKTRFHRESNGERLLPERRTTLEDMILKFEMEEKKAAKRSDTTLLMSARDALTHYPRFSLDGKDAMYRSSFRNGGRGAEAAAPARRSVCCDYGVGRRMGVAGAGAPATFAGERVVWCKPGVVAKLMGLDALPVPVNTRVTVDRRRRDMLLLGTGRFHRDRHPTHQ